MSSLPDRDLLAPSIAEDHDLSTFDSPWNPASTVFVCLGGPFAAAWVLSENDRRLGLHASVRVRLWSFLALGCAMGAATAYYVHAKGWELGELRGQGRTVRNLATLGSVLPGLWVASRQKPRFRVFLGAGGEAASLLGPGLLMWFVGGLAYLLYLVTLLYAFVW